MAPKKKSKANEIAAQKRAEARAKRDARLIMNEQGKTSLSIRKLPFARFVREIAHGFDKEIRFERTAIDMLQEACEKHIVKKLLISNLIAFHSKRVTVDDEDLRLSDKISTFVT